jgi:hypothetical protein
MFDGWDGPDIATFWIAIGAVLLSVISLAWQAWTWRHSGAIVQVTARLSMPVFDHGPGGPWTCVTATNKGRGPTTVASWGFETPNGSNIVVPRALPGPSPLPFLIPAGGAQGDWFAETDGLRATCYQDVAAHHHLVQIGGLTLRQPLEGEVARRSCGGKALREGVRCRNQDHE